MAHGQLQPVLHYLRRVLDPECAPGVSDTQLGIGGTTSRVGHDDRVVLGLRVELNHVRSLL